MTAYLPRRIKQFIASASPSFKSLCDVLATVLSQESQALIMPNKELSKQPSTETRTRNSTYIIGGKQFLRSYFSRLDPLLHIEVFKTELE